MSACSFGMMIKIPTDQEYELILADTNGHVLWKWSDDHVFTPAIHDKLVTGKWTATVSFPRPFRRISGPVPAGTSFKAGGQPQGRFRSMRQPYPSRFAIARRLARRCFDRTVIIPSFCEGRSDH
jgi:hypothetical protein